MVEIIPDSTTPKVRRVSDFEIEDNEHSYIIAISQYGTPYVMTKVKRGSSVSYVFLKIDGKQFVCDKKNRRLAIDEALNRGYRIFAVYNQLEFLETLHKALGKRIEIKKSKSAQELEGENEHANAGQGSLEPHS